MNKTWWMVAILAASGVAHADDPMEANARRLAAAQAPGAAQVGGFLKGEKEKTDFQVMLEAGKCYWFSAVSAGNVKKIATFLWAPGSNAFTPRLTSERSEAGNVVLNWCTKEPGMYRFQTKIEGKGVYTIGVFAKDAPPQQAVAVAQGPNLNALCNQEASKSAPGAKLVGDFFAGSGSSFGRDDRVQFPVQLDAGKCYWIVACGEPEHIKSLSLYLWSQENKRIANNRNSDSPNPMLGHCAKETGMYKFEVKVSGGSGKFQAGVYSK